MLTNCLLVSFSELELRCELKARVDHLVRPCLKMESAKSTRDAARGTGLAWMKPWHLSHQHPQNEISTCSLPKSCLSVCVAVLLSPLLLLLYDPEEVSLHCATQTLPADLSPVPSTLSASCEIRPPDLTPLLPLCHSVLPFCLS